MPADGLIDGPSALCCAVEGSAGDEAAVDEEGLRGDPTAARADQELDQRRDLVDFAEPVLRAHAGEEGLRFRAFHRVEEGGVERAGCYGVDGDAPVADLLGKRAREVFERRLGARIDRV